MTAKPVKLAIINRSFWPVYPVIGEALLRFAEQTVSSGNSVTVIMQDHADIRKKLAEAERGKGVRFYPAKAWTNSASSVLLRAFDAIFFMAWVLAVLIWVRPGKVYVSTDPPVVVPFIVMLYCRLFRAEYIYHLQDIHPEAANVVIPVNQWLYRILLKMDALTMRKAKCLITITGQMADEIRSRSGTTVPVHILDNPAVSFDNIDLSKPKIAGFSFCGNAGRLQRIPLILDAIEAYFDQGGQLIFVFAGGGIYSDRLKSFSDRFEQFHYAGLVTPVDAAQINADYSWALLPIEDEVTRYAFPSKSSSYVFSGAHILAVCGEQTGVAQWIKKHGVGVVAEPNVEALVKIFFDIERDAIEANSNDQSREILKEKLKFEVFVENLFGIVR
ncbi:glycosyltransferase [Nitrincola iocasae]|uniref:Glycosyltransferase family 4 protein n=1 Tax=Nitrincola iocasae TaxID=2614693 RepID=A0A5J6LC02_9GAMM|nr:glycosyltransferase [Nitrincola iocasae]QEW05936.1 glycosyltransferase family 4 protein [Nitrincola iocasae]